MAISTVQPRPSRCVSNGFVAKQKALGEPSRKAQGPSAFPANLDLGLDFDLDLDPFSRGRLLLL